MIESPNYRVPQSPNRYALSATTLTLTCAVTSRWIFTGTVVSPSAFNGSCSWIFRLSISKPFACSACAISADVTEPYSVWCSPTRRAISISSCAEALRDRFGLCLLFGVLDFRDLLLALDLALVVVGDRQRQLPREQKIPRVARGDLHDVSAAAEIIDVLSQNDFHSLCLSWVRGSRFGFGVGVGSAVRRWVRVQGSRGTPEPTDEPGTRTANDEPRTQPPNPEPTNPEPASP